MEEEHQEVCSHCGRRVPLPAFREHIWRCGMRVGQHDMTDMNMSSNDLRDGANVEDFPLGTLVEAHSLSTVGINGLRGHVTGIQGDRVQVDFGEPKGSRALCPANVRRVTAQRVASEPQATFWKVVKPPGDTEPHRVRAAKDFRAEVLSTYLPGTTVRAYDDGDWIALVDIPGFMYKFVGPESSWVVMQQVQAPSSVWAPAPIRPASTPVPISQRCRGSLGNASAPLYVPGQPVPSSESRGSVPRPRPRRATAEARMAPERSSRRQRQRR